MKAADQALPRPVSPPSVTTEDALRLADEIEPLTRKCRPDNLTQGVAAMAIRSLVSERDALAGRVRGLEAALKPNLFWNDADPEHGETSIFEVIDREWNGGCMKHGDEMVIQQAVRLPNIRVRLIPCPTDGDDYFDYEVIDAALSTTPESKP